MECDKILDKIMNPTFTTVLKGVISLGDYNYGMMYHNNKVYKEYNKCVLENIKLKISRSSI